MRIPYHLDTPAFLPAVTTYTCFDAPWGLDLYPRLLPLLQVRLNKMDPYLNIAPSRAMDLKLKILSLHLALGKIQWLMKW
jgi:hypothetical protein